MRNKAARGDIPGVAQKGGTWLLPASWLRSQGYELPDLFEQAKEEDEEPVRTIGKSLWIGSEGRAFERVAQAFRNAGYAAPEKDKGTYDKVAIGAYVSNIMSQYQRDLTERQVRAIIRYGLSNSLEQLQAQSDYTLEDIMRDYDDSEETKG